jgi:signal transduction histidine kinase/ActR/RegA family two-component response regulator
LTLAANSEVVHLLEHQTDTMGQQNQLIVGLTVAQLVLLLIASGALVVRQRRLEAERLALEQMTEELRDAHFQAEAANRGKSQFLANMSHELRTPFNGLMGMLGLLESTPVNQQQADYIRTAQESARHLLTLLNDILDLSALESGKMTIKPAELQLARLMTEVNALMLPLATAKGLEFQLRVPDVPLPPVLADETRVKQILFNLISNAIKFTASGQVVVNVTERSRSVETLEIVFDVQDTGIGMDDAVLSRLFQRFYQVEDGASRQFGGTGLGLEISRSLARMMDGDITASSIVGQGSTFSLLLRLPIAIKAAGPVAVTASPALVAPQAQDVQGLRVLVVEDHPINQKLVGVLLGRMGCHISYSENGQLAVERVQQEPFDLILMDVNMPVMDGLTATRLIRLLPGAVAQTPIVVLTADVMNEAREQALAAGANDFISKPLNVEQLRTIISQYAKMKE